MSLISNFLLVRHRGRLEISQAKFKDGGAYVCKAKNFEHAYGGRSIAIVKVYRGFYFRYTRNAHHR